MASRNVTRGNGAAAPKPRARQTRKIHDDNAPGRVLPPAVGEEDPHFAMVATRVPETVKLEIARIRRLTGISEHQWLRNLIYKELGIGQDQGATSTEPGV